MKKLTKLMLAATLAGSAITANSEISPEFNLGQPMPQQQMADVRGELPWLLSNERFDVWYEDYQNRNYSWRNWIGVTPESARAATAFVVCSAVYISTVDVDGMTYCYEDYGY
jgi:hypothetical protein